MVVMRRRCQFAMVRVQAPPVKGLVDRVFELRNTSLNTKLTAATSAFSNMEGVTASMKNAQRGFMKLSSFSASPDITEDAAKSFKFRDFHHLSAERSLTEGCQKVNALTHLLETPVIHAWTQSAERRHFNMDKSSELEIAQDLHRFLNFSANDLAVSPLALPLGEMAKHFHRTVTSQLPPGSSASIGQLQASIFNKNGTHGYVAHFPASVTSSPGAAARTFNVHVLLHAPVSGGKAHSGLGAARAQASGLTKRASKSDIFVEVEFPYLPVTPQTNPEAPISLMARDWMCVAHEFGHAVQFAVWDEETLHDIDAAPHFTALDVMESMSVYSEITFLRRSMAYKQYAPKASASKIQSESAVQELICSVLGGLKLTSAFEQALWATHSPLSAPAEADPTWSTLKWLPVKVLADVAPVFDAHVVLADPKSKASPITNLPLWGGNGPYAGSMSAYWMAACRAAACNEKFAPGNLMSLSPFRETASGNCDLPWSLSSVLGSKTEELRTQMWENFCTPNANDKILMSSQQSPRPSAGKPAVGGVKAAPVPQKKVGGPVRKA